MARKARTREDMQRRVVGDGLIDDTSTDGRSSLDRIELVSAACRLFCEGYPATQITTILQEQFPDIPLTRESPYQLIAYAARRRWIQFAPPEEHDLSDRFKGMYPSLNDAHVVHTAASEDVAQGGARMLLDLVRRHAERKPSPAEVHVGFSGGWTMLTLARKFAELLRQPKPGLPEKIVFHALVSGFDVSEPTTDPNAFFTYFVRDLAMQVETAFVGLHAPALVDTEQFPSLRDTKGIAEAYKVREQIDIVVTSASLAADPHGMLQRYFEYSGASLAQLEEAGCVGDMLWRPISASGPIDLGKGLRAMTIVELADLCALIEQKKSVLLVAGPCGVCHTPKADVVRAVLDQPKRLITDLVVDSRCARALVDPHRK